MHLTVCCRFLISSGLGGEGRELEGEKQGGWSEGENKKGWRGGAPEKGDQDTLCS